MSTTPDAPPDAALNAAPLARVIYASYDAEGAPRSFAVEQVRAYTAAGCDVLVADASPSRAREAAWCEAGAQVLARENRGYDFAGWRDALAALSLCTRMADAPLLLTNDSCYGPFRPLAPLLRQLARRQHETVVTALTDSYEHSHHLQSYWLHVQPPALPALCSFLRDQDEARDRSQAIRQGELALSRHLREHGVQLAALCPAGELLAAATRPRLRTALELGLRRLFARPRDDYLTDAVCLDYALLGRDSLSAFNPSLGFGPRLYHSGATPFIKRQLLRDNPYHRSDLPGHRGPPLTNEQARALLEASLAKPNRHAS